MPAPSVSDLTLSLYGSLGWLTLEDEANDWALLKMVATWVEVNLDPVYELAREGPNGEPPWSKLYDPDECPAFALPYLAMHVGVVITPEMNEAQIRDECREPTGLKRGQPEAIRVATRRTLTGENPLVIIRSRTPEPFHHYVRTLLAETPDPARTERVVREEVPAWEKLDYEAFVGMTWADVIAKYATWADVVAEVPTWQDLIEDTP